VPLMDRQRQQRWLTPVANAGGYTGTHARIETLPPITGSAASIPESLAQDSYWKNYQLRNRALGRG